MDGLTSLQALNTTGIAVSCLFILFIFSKKNRKRADYLLVLINLLMISFLVLDIQVAQQLTLMRFFTQTVTPYLLFPTYLFFALDILQEKIHAKGRWVLLFVPAIISISYVARDLFFINQYDFGALQKLYNTPPIGYQFMYKGNQIFFLLALIGLLARIKKYSSDIRKNFSFIDPIQLSWIRNSTWLYVVIMIISLVSFLISNFNLLSLDIQMAYSIVSVCIVLATFYISFHGIRQYTIADYYGRLSQGIEPNSPSAKKNQEKYKTSSLTQSEQESIYQNLLLLLAQRQLYLEPKLQLQEVADELKVTTHSLSQTINSLSGMPFYDLVNGYRVRHMQKLLADASKKKFTILALGMESGFNSKASLNRVFKEETGLSPKEYQQRHLSP